MQPRRTRSNVRAAGNIGTIGSQSRRFNVKAQRYFSAFIVAVAMAVSVPALAQRPASAPKNATGQCKDDTFTTAKTERGACSQHGGVKTWFDTAAAPAPAAKGATTPTTK